MSTFWSSEEIKLIVNDYLAMLKKELAGNSYNKAYHNRTLQPLLNNRSKSSIEFKHQNITAILHELGYPAINGYKPAKNYQRELKSYLEGELQRLYPGINDDSEKFINLLQADDKYIDWGSVITDAPETLPKKKLDRVREFTPRLYNFSEREANNRQLGLNGEEFVIEFESRRMKNAGREDLAKKIEWTSKIRGDGAGYDIKSFDPITERELFIEVKTTNSGKYQPFYISSNEVNFSDINSKNYSLYRVFNFNKSPKIFTIPGSVSEHLTLEVEAFKAIFK